MAKSLKFDAEARRALKEGVDTMANALKVTLGPRGRNVVMQRIGDSPLITNDGVSIAREIELKDAARNLGATLIREVTEKTQEKAGDGTTTAGVLAQAIVAQGLRRVEAGHNPMHLKRGIDKAVDVVTAELRKQAIPVRTLEAMEQAATIGAGGDAALGSMVAKALDAVGTDGVVQVEEGESLETVLEMVDGLEFDRGYLSPYFITDADRMTADLEEPFLLLYDDKIHSLQELLPILEQVVQVARPLLVICEEVEGEALATLVVNRLRGMLQVAAVRSPGFGDQKDEILEDLAIFAGGNVISKRTGSKLESAHLTDLGSVKRAVIAKESTTLTQGGGKASEVKARADQLRMRIEKAESESEREPLRERMARIAGKVAVLKAGGATQTEILERKGRLEDSLAATRAAVQEGVVPGGGVALLRTLPALSKLKGGNEGETQGIEIVKAAITVPARLLSENAGFEGGTVVQEILSRKGAEGLNVATGKWTDLVEDGVVDPVMVTRTALENAASIGALILTTEAVVNEVPEEEDDGDEEED